MGISKMSGKPGKILGDSLVLEWHPIQGEKCTPCSFMLWKAG